MLTTTSIVHVCSYISDEMSLKAWLCYELMILHTYMQRILCKGARGAQKSFLYDYHHAQ